MTEREMAEIIEKYTSKSWYNIEPSTEAKAAAKEIFEKLPAGFGRFKNPSPIDAPFYPTLSCDCGAERINPTAKHATWCMLVTRRPHRH